MEKPELLTASVGVVEQSKQSSVALAVPAPADSAIQKAPALKAPTPSHK
jgi:hypothetical protein